MEINEQTNANLIVDTATAYLGLAMIADAVGCLTGTACDVPHESLAARTVAAEDWLANPDSRAYPLSFAACVALAAGEGANPDKVLAGIRQRLGRHQRRGKAPSRHVVTGAPLTGMGSPLSAAWRKVYWHVPGCDWCGHTDQHTHRWYARSEQEAVSLIENGVGMIGGEPATVVNGKITIRL